MEQNITHIKECLERALKLCIELECKQIGEKAIVEDIVVPEEVDCKVIPHKDDFIKAAKAMLRKIAQKLF